jgi:KGK domain
VSKQFHPLADGEVVSVQSTYRVSELAAQIRSKIADTLAEWSNEQGVDGEALRFGSPGWEKGKVRLHLSIEFCPNEDAGQTVPSAQTAHQPTAPAVNTASASAAAFGMAATHAVASSDADDSFELGTMSEVSGEIDLNLSDEHSGYVDFDLSAAMPDLNLEELVANVQAGRPSLVEEVWSEIEQPNWPGVTRAQA